MSKELIGPALKVRRLRALVRLEGRRNDGRAFIEPGEICEMADADAQIYLAAGLVEELPEDSPLGAGKGG